jgi:hypothetical protein
MCVIVKKFPGKKECETVRSRDAITNFLSPYFGAKYSHIFTQSP